MRCALLLAFIGVSILAGPFSAQAQDDERDVPKNIVAEKITLRALDKVTATTQDFTVDVGDTLNYGSLEILIRHCEYKPPTETPETAAFLEIKDRRLDGTGEEAESQKIFSGWMFASSPALNALEHRVYDVWVIACST